jgi:DNA-binding GntR family transcriptional regulator
MSTPSTKPNPGRRVLSGRKRPLLTDVVRTELRSAITTGEFPAGSKLPNEEQLCERFDVSRITLREAVQGLVQEGYLVRRQGSGTYVTRRPSLHNSLDTNFSYTEYLKRSGIHAGKKIISIRVAPADAGIAEALALEPATEVVEVRRIRTAGRRPAIYSVDHIPADVIDMSTDRKALGGSLYRLFALKGLPVDHGEAVLLPAMADEELATLLDVDKGTLLQHLRQVDYDVTGRALMLSLEWHLPSVIELRVYRRGPGPMAAQSD